MAFTHARKRILRDLLESGAMSLRFLPILVLACLSTLCLASPAGATTLVQQTNVQWNGTMTSPSTVSTFVMPGIGTGEIRCQTNATWIKIRPYNRYAETSMWSSKYEIKQGAWSSSVKNARVYQYAHMDDTAGSGTGPTTREGFNQQRGANGVENASQGYRYCLITQRRARNVQIGAAIAPPATQIYLTWWWTGFDGAIGGRQCVVKARIVTHVTSANVRSAKYRVRTARWRKVRWGRGYRVIGTRARLAARPARSLQVDWRGDADPAPREKSVSITGVGTIRMTCSHEHTWLTIIPTSSNAGAHVTRVEGEGFEATSEEQYLYDYEDQQISPIELPVNGMLRVGLVVDGRKVNMQVSTWHLLNQPVGSERLNYCEAAALITG
jgi:hypothetical protein